MLLASRPCPHPSPAPGFPPCPDQRPHHRRAWPARTLALALTVSVLGLIPGIAAAQTARPSTDPMLADPAPAAPAHQAASATPGTANGTQKDDADQRPFDFQADRVDYDDNADVVTASGNVYLRRDDQSVRADTVTWNRASGQIVASGHVRLVDQSGSETLTDRVQLTDKFSAGTMGSLIMVLREGGRIAASSGSRDEQGRLHLSHTNYTSCDIVDAKGCPIQPSWRITAHNVVYTPDKHAFRMYGAHLVMFGLVRIPLPNLMVTTDGRALSGLLIPNATTSSQNGIGYNQTLLLRLSENRDLSLTGYVYSAVDPMASVQYRALNDTGSYQITGYATRSEVIPQASTANADAAGTERFRGYIDTNGHFQLSPAWDIDFSGRLASDRTFLSRYYITGDDVLRSTVNAERIDAKSYLSIAGWAFETLRPGEAQGQVPLALPQIDYRRLITDPLLGGTLQIQGNSLGILRSAGQDTQRAFVSAEWDLSRMTRWGQIVTFTALMRGDLYHTANTAQTDIIEPGTPGWHTRGMVLGAIDVKWPLIGTLFGGTQVLTPRVQIVGAPPVPNARIPNEDSQSVELEDTNIFALNRFAGYDRFEDGARVTYGANWQFDRPRWHIDGDIAQSWRFTNNRSLFPQGTGLYDKMSDVVGRFDIRYLDLFKVTERFNISKGMSFPYNEVDLTIGSDKNYIEIGYLYENNGPAALLNGLENSDELRGAVRTAFARYWSIFASGVFDLSRSQLVDGGMAKPLQPLRTRIGFSFRSDCFEADLTWRKDYVSIGDAAKGSSFIVHLTLRNLGLR